MNEDDGAPKPPNVLKFPRAFMFYSKILHTPSTFAFVAHCMSIIVILQQIGISLFPILIRTRTRQTESHWVYRTLCMVMYGRPEFFWEQCEDSYAAKTLASLSLFMIPCAVAYAQHVWGFETPSFLKQTRCLLVFFQPNYVVLALTLHSAKFVNKLVVDGYSLSVVMRLLTDSAVSAIAQGMTQALWPFLYGNPMLGDAQMPSRLIPAMSVDRFMQAQVWLVGLATFIPNQMTLMFITASFIVLGVLKWYDMWSLPYMSMYHTALNSMVAVSFVMAPVLFWISARYESLTDAKLLFYTMIVNAIAFVLSLVKYSRLEAKVLDDLVNQDHLEFSSSKEAIMYAQFAVLNNCITPELVDALRDVSKTEKDIHLTMCRLYCEILITDDAYSSEVQRIVRNLFSIHSLCEMDKLVAYQIYQTIVQDRLVCEEPDAANLISARVEEYKRKSDEFWTNSILGNIGEASRLLHELAYMLTDLIADFEALSTFYPSDPHVIMLEYDFFRHFRYNSGTFDSLTMSSMLKKRHLRYIGSTQFVEKQLSNDESDTISRTSSDEDKTFGRMTENFQLYFTPHVSVLVIVLFGMSAIWMVVVAAMTIYPTQKYVETVSKLSNMQTMIMNLQDITYVSGKIWSLIGQLVNNTNVMDPGIVSSYNSSAVNMEEFAENLWTMHKSMCRFTNDFLVLTNLPEFQDFVHFWKSERVSVAMSLDKNNTEEASMDLMSYFLYFSSIVSEMIRAHPGKNLTGHQRIIRFVRLRAEEWLSNWDSVPLRVQTAMDILQKFGSDVRDRAQSELLHVGYNRVIIALIGSLVISVATALNIDSDRKNMILKHFRPAKHPNPDIGISRSDVVNSKNVHEKGSVHMFMSMVLILMFVAHEAFVKAKVEQTTEIIMSDLDSILDAGRLTVMSARLFDAVLRTWQFHSEERMNHALRLCDLFSDQQNSLVKSVVLFEATEIPSEFFERASRYNRSSSESDVYEGYTVIELATVFVMTAREILQAGASIENDRYHHLTRLYRVIFIPKSQKAINVFMNQVDEKIALLVGVSQIQEFFVILYLLMFIGYLLGEFISFVIVTRQFARFMLAIPPRTIAENDCMMTYFIAGDGKLLSSDGQNSMMTSIYSRSHSAVLMCSMSHTIVAFTPNVSAMFSYRSEQLVGQSIELLIPKEASISGQNDTKFYQQLQIVKNEQTDLSFEKDLIGMSSDGSLLQLHVSVSLIEYQGVQLFLIQIRSISDVLYYEEMISSYGEFYNQLCQGSYAFQLFPEFLTTTIPMQQTFNHSALVGVFIDRSRRDDEEESVKQISEGSLVDYLSDNNDCCILGNSSHHVIILFVDRDGTSSYLENAIKFYYQYYNAGVGCRGFIVTENETKLILFPPPLIPDGYFGYEMPYSVANALVPSITFEVITPIIESIPELLRQMQQYRFIVSPDVLELIPNRDELYVHKIDKMQHCEVYAVSSGLSPRLPV